MELQDDVDNVESRFGPFGDSVSFGARQVHGLCQTYHRLRNHFGRTRWNSKVTWVLRNLASFHLETVLVSVQDRCMVCAKNTIGSKIILVHLEMVLVLMQDRCTVCAKRTIGSKIFLDPPNGTPG